MRWSVLPLLLVACAQPEFSHAIVEVCGSYALDSQRACNEDADCTCAEEDCATIGNVYSGGDERCEDEQCVAQTPASLDFLTLAWPDCNTIFDDFEVVLNGDVLDVEPRLSDLPFDPRVFEPFLTREGEVDRTCQVVIVPLDQPFDDDDELTLIRDGQTLVVYRESQTCDFAACPLHPNGLPFSPTAERQCSTPQ